MGNFVADAMRAKYADDGVQAAITNSGGLRPDLFPNAISGGEQPGEITWGEAFAVLPFGNATVIETRHVRAARRPRCRTASGRRAATRPAAPAARRSTRACGSSSTATASCR